MRKSSLWGWLSLTGIVGAAVAAGCSGSSAPVGQFSGAVGGEPCSSVGQTQNASDGCNTCSCGTDGKWSCTEKACGGGSGSGSGGSSEGGATCKEGDTKTAPDGCNSCSCTKSGDWACTEIGCVAECTQGQMKTVDCNTCGCIAGHWSCTLKDCAPAMCPAPVPSGGACDAVIVWAKDPVGGMCCMYGTPCTSPAGWKTFNTESACTGAATCPAPAAPGGGCVTVIVYAKDPATGICCEYGDPCRSPQGWKTYGTDAECQKAAQ